MLRNTSVDETDSPSSFRLGISTFRDHISAQFFYFLLLRPANCDQKMRQYPSLYFYQADHYQLRRGPAFHCFVLSNSPVQVLYNTAVKYIVLIFMVS